ncbi:FAD-dependent monooxygenase [Wenzhouxiangella sp. AB-CW3]|uniref:FAD-dependent monooxygenase n=1 Tax=Wenzhouxiangella sp. AB-CW3 TaxID=2771012 RepID=UPI00168AE1CE|nr:FAD-dependent monooxygenase [Wenzhouxiangella sp. AB-CW3]QOC23308.1 FAD-dependent monooxygenase [Wenzhouxiangella sp. AB-CW3]
MSKDFDVALAGGGVAGAVTAALLARQGRRVALVDRKRPSPLDPKSEFDPRVVAISPGARNVLIAAGVWPNVPAERIGPYARMVVHADGGRVEFAASQHGLEDLGWIVEIPALQAAAWALLDNETNVALLAPAGVAAFEARRNRLQLDIDPGDPVRAKLLVAADGARSRLREQAGIETDLWHYNQHALVTHITTQQANPGIAWQRFTEHGPLALLPLADGRSSIVWSQPAERAQTLRDMDEADFLDELNDHQDAPFGPASACTRRYTLPLVRRQSRQLVAGRLALLGDAARTVHPLAGQGLNLGLMDAAALAEVLADWQGEEDPASALARYERWRLSAGTLIAGGIHAINEITAGNPLGRRAAAIGFGAASALWPLRQLFVKRACGLDSDSPRLARHAP